MDITTIVDITVKLLGIIGIIVALFQLFEVRRKRAVDMFWKIREIYCSREQEEARLCISRAQEKLLNFKSHRDAGTLGDPGVHEGLAAQYVEKLHDASEEDDGREIATGVRKRIRFLHQCGILLRQGLIQRDMLFGLIGPGLKIDWPLLSIALKGHREAHHIPGLYDYVEYLFTRYNRYERARGEPPNPVDWAQPAASRPPASGN